MAPFLGEREILHEIIDDIEKNNGLFLLSKSRFHVNNILRFRVLHDREVLDVMASQGRQ